MSAAVLDQLAGRIIGDAVIAATHWAVEARPEILAYLALREAEDGLRRADRAPHDEASRIVREAAEDLLAEIVILRDEAIDRETPEAPAPNAGDEAWEAYEDFRDTLGNVISVNDALRLVEREPVK